jgi:hypothetical protein
MVWCDSEVYRFVSSEFVVVLKILTLESCGWGFSVATTCVAKIIGIVRLVFGTSHVYMF